MALRSGQTVVGGIGSLRLRLLFFLVALAVAQIYRSFVYVFRYKQYGGSLTIFTLSLSRRILLRTVSTVGFYLFDSIHHDRKCRTLYCRRIRGLRRIERIDTRVERDQNGRRSVGKDTFDRRLRRRRHGFVQFYM